MAKKIRKRRANYFDNGGFSWQKGAGFGKNMSNAFNSGALSGAIGAAGSMVGQGISGGLSSGAGNALQGLGSIASAIPGPWGAIAGAGLNVVGGLVNKAFGSQINERAVQEAKAANTQQSNMQFAASNTADLLDQSNFGLLGSIKKSDIGKDGWFSNKVKKLTAELNRQREIANQQAIANFGIAAENMDAQNDFNALANYAAYGGPLNPYSAGALVDAIYSTFKREKYLGKPSHNYDFTISEEEANKLGYYPDERGHRDDRVKKPTHPTHPSRGKWKSFEEFELTDRGMENPNYTLFGLNDGGQDPQAVMTYNGDIVLPEITVTPKGSYIMNPYDNIKIFDKGGPLTMKYTGTMSPFGNTFADGGKIYIKPENRGKFTALKERTGKSATWFKEHGTPAQKKMATFALNARKWKHAFGGDLLTHGAEWDNGITIIGNGGTHEESPYEGVQIGVDAEGIPNLVEEGEVIFNDYVFSDRMDVPNSIRSSLGLSKGKNLTFAKAAKKLSKEAEERPNDPISKRGLMSSMTRLQQAQEIVREEKQASLEGRQYAHGGKMGNLFDGTGPEDNYLEARNFYDNYLNNTYGKNPNTSNYSLTGKNNVIPSTMPSYTPAPDDNELLDIARVRLGEEPKGKVTPVLEPLINSNSNTSNTNNNSNLTWLRYAPVVGAAIGLGQNIFSKPDYSSSNAVLNAANEVGRYTPVGFNPLGDYLTYRPFDRNYYINKLNAQSGATRRAIVNQSAGNRATALAGLLAADYNAQSKLGDLARQAEEYNLAQREKVASFNRGTNQFNSEMGLKAAMANQEAALKAKSQRLSGVTQAMQMRDAVDARRGASMSANLTNLFDSLGNIGIDAYNREDRDKLIRAGVFGTLSEKPQEWSDETWKEYKDYINKSLENKTPKVKSKQHSKGGYLTIKKGK